MTMSEGNIGSLEEQALKRRQKLLNLKRRKEGNKYTTDQNNQGKNHEELPAPIFRSYKPADTKLHDNLLPTAPPEDVGHHVKNQLDLAKSEIVIDQLDVTSLAPRKPDWDLKRDVSKKMEKLERQTQRAIAELIRERLKERKDLADLANAQTENL